MLDKTLFQHALQAEPKIFLISCTKRDRKNFLTNKYWAGFYLRSQHVGDIQTGHIAAKKESSQT